MELPNLFIPGAAKSGTSSLHEYLDLHPLISMSSAKEPHLFSIKENWDNRDLILTSLFRSGERNIYHGESSTSYMVSHDATLLLKEFVENPKFIFLLRNPIDRLISHYNWMRSLDKEEDEFKTAFLKSIGQEFDPYKTNGGCYKFYCDFSQYGKHIERYISIFGRSSIHIVQSELLKDHCQEALSSCFQYLELPDVTISKIVTNNKTKNLIKNNVFSKYIKKYKGVLPNSFKRHVNTVFDYRSALELVYGSGSHVSVDEKDRKRLRDYFWDDVRKMVEMTGISDVWSEFKE